MKIKNFDGDWKSKDFETDSWVESCNNKKIDKRDKTIDGILDINKDEEEDGGKLSYEIPLKNLIKYSDEDIKPLLSFLREINSNWDCDEDAHRYNTICRCCDAEKTLNEWLGKHK